MELRDLIVTPILLIVIAILAYIIRPRVTDSVNRVYFFPALAVKIFGALSVGFIYQFYYGGGDTFNYHTYGSRYIWEAFGDDPVKGVKLLLSDGNKSTELYKYTSKILFFGDPHSYAVVKTAAIFDLLTFSSYSATAVLFAVLCFAGMWMFFLTFYQQYPQLHRWFAIASFFYSIGVLLGIRIVERHHNVRLPWCRHIPSVSHLHQKEIWYQSYFFF